jgi:hypothetical protein
VSRRAAIWISALLAGAVVVFAVSCAVRLAWLADDSFISFRYAWNLVHGHGLVYNAGEYVAGYTNLLWTLLMAAAMAVGVTPEISSKVLGIVCWLLLAGVLAFRSWRHRDRAFLPLAAALVLLMDDYQTWATGGLETSLFTLLSVAGVLLASEPRAGTWRLVLAGSLLAAAVATRPDGVVFAAVGVAGAWFVHRDVPSRERLALLAAVTLPLIVVGVALASFTLLYYGDLFPTAFYSKSALDPYYGQGFTYLVLFLGKNWFIVPLAGVLLIGGAGRRSAVFTRRHLILFAACGAFVLYVAHSGGDFMFARRLIPAMPFLFPVLEDELVSAPRVVIKIAAVALVAVGLALPYPVYREATGKVRGIANEPAYSTKAYIAMREGQARVAARAFGPAPVRAMFEGGMCMFAYYSRLPYLAEMSGLTQYSLAKQPLASRGYIGHEKVGDARWLTENRIQFVFSQAWPPVPRLEPRRVDEIYFGDTLKARIWIYLDAIMDPLRENPDVQFVPIEGALRAARRQIGQASYEEARGSYDFLDRYYFRTAGPEKKALADDLREEVAARRTGKKGA